MWFFVVCALIVSDYASLLFSQTFVFLLFLYAERVCKSFWKESLTTHVAHLHNAAHAFSSPNRCFQWSTNLDKDLFRYLWYFGVIGAEGPGVKCFVIPPNSKLEKTAKKKKKKWVAWRVRRLCFQYERQSNRAILPKRHDNSLFLRS